MPEKEMWNLQQMVSHVITLMDEAETPELGELFEKIRWALGEQEHTIATLAGCIEAMTDSHLAFSEAWFKATEEINQRYNKPRRVE